MQETKEMRVWSLGPEDPLAEGMAVHSSAFVWSIPWTEEPRGLQSMGSQRVGHDWNDCAHTSLRILQCQVTSYMCVGAQSCSILHPMDCSPPGSTVHGILQAGILEWVATSYSRLHMYMCRTYTYKTPLNLCLAIHKSLFTAVKCPVEHSA